MKPKVIFIDKVHPILYERLEGAGYQCDWKDHLNREEILSILHQYHGAVLRSKFKFDRQVFEIAKNLRWIARSGSGMENIDIKEASERGIECFNSPEGNRDAVAEHCIAMILGLFNRINHADREVKEGYWNREQNRGIELMGKTVGILGYGFMGQAFSQRLKGFGVKTIAYDKYKKNYSSDLVEELDLERFFEETDILSIHLPLTRETNMMINQHFINQFHKDIYIINSARGNIIATEHLVSALKSGKIKGACLDVLEYEELSFENLKSDTLPTAYQYLRECTNVLLSPHIAGWTEESYFKLSSVLADKIIKATMA